MLSNRRNDEADAARAATDDSLCALLVANASAYTPLAPILPQPIGKNWKIQVACRCRPLLPAESAAVGTTITGGITHVPEFPNCTVLDSEVHVHTERRRIGVPDPLGALDTKKFRLHAAFTPQCEDESIYGTLVSPLLDLARSGGRSAVIAYGQTGSGKTYSMGNLMSRAAEDIFLDQNVHVAVSFFELRGESAYDLLSDRKELCIRQDAVGAIDIGGLSELAVGSAEELKNVIERGLGLRQTAATTGNAQSSRSHAFCDIKYNGKGVLRFVDLAGSERRADSVDHDLERINEMKEINGSLGNLKECIRLVLANSLTKKKQHVPYRRSKLTRLLKAELGGHQQGDEGGEVESRTAFLLHVSPMRSAVLHTMNTLRYGEAMIAANSANKAKGTDAWSSKKVSAWVAQLDGGKYAELADSFHLSGKMFGSAWIGDIIKRTEGAGGTEADGNDIYDAFHRVRLRLKKTQGRPPAKVCEDKKQPTLQDPSMNENKASTIVNEPAV